MPAERINFFQLGVGFLEHPKLDVAVRAAQVQLISAFEGLEIGRYEKFDRECQIFRGGTAFLIEQFKIAGMGRIRIP